MALISTRSQSTARKTVLVCDNCGNEIDESKGAVMRINFNDARRGATNHGTTQFNAANGSLSLALVYLGVLARGLRTGEHRALAARIAANPPHAVRMTKRLLTDNAVETDLGTIQRREQEMLVETRPDLYYLPPYLAPSGWVGLRLDSDEVDWDHVADRIAISWELVAPKRLLEMGGR